MDNYSFEKKSTELSESVEYYMAANISNEAVAASYDAVLGILIMAATTVAGFRFLYLKSPFHLDKFKPIKPNLFHKLAQPNCKKCRFYNRNAEVQCRVHPVRVKFVEAQTCPDYWQRDRSLFLHR